MMKKYFLRNDHNFLISLTLIYVHSENSILNIKRNKVHKAKESPSGEGQFIDRQEACQSIYLW